jgi:hypothetical protein
MLRIEIARQLSRVSSMQLLPLLIMLNGGSCRLSKSAASKSRQFPVYKCILPETIRYETVTKFFLKLAMEGEPRRLVAWHLSGM